ncbi:hypothetical protein QAD02_005902 [Eretmocerus hayati]|uniref:Uncharacterized protein n=1 Tax=Eretmocerus hayati TaxID=131215 RepID=A0ACC2MZJ9_9HYME|nr:hypothetical protein QAD02_005902 [Eretmocerus hayati]
MDRWIGKSAVVTGASSGVGACLVERLVGIGMKVAGLARRRDRLYEMMHRLNGMAKPPASFLAVPCDLSNEDEILAAFEIVERILGPVHVLVNNAAVLAFETIVDGDTATMRKILETNVLAAALCIREASHSMRRHGTAGHVVNINSIGGHEASQVHTPVSLYCASKYALAGMSESVRNELAHLGTGIKVTSVSPGTIRTEMIKTVGVTDDEISKMPILEPTDVVNAIIYALSTPKHVQVNELIITPLKLENPKKVVRIKKTSK